MEPEHPQFAEPAEAAGLGLMTEIEPGLKLRGVPETVTELAGILLDNAVKYSAPGSVISLGLAIARALAENLKNQKVFAREEQQLWQCRNCGYTFIGKSAPLKCPVCAHPQSYFELKKINY